MDGSSPRVLLAHNSYRLRGGEERSVAEIASLLRDHGHTVGLLERASADLAGRAGHVRGALGMLRGGERPFEAAAATRSLRADVVHAHNIHPILGPRALVAARANGAAVVLHLHNFRFSCAIGVAYRDGAPCFDCRGRDTLPGLRHRCRGSFAEAAVYAVGLAAHQRVIAAVADRFIAPSETTAARLGELGVPVDRLVVMPNFLPAGSFVRDSAADRGSYALFAGRLAAEKGVDVAIAAAMAAGVPLRIAGTGPDEVRLRALARGADVRFEGHLGQPELARLRRGAGVVMLPSRWEEPCPYAALEALAAGVPVLASSRGGLAELAGQGAVPAGEDSAAWAAALASLWADPGLRRERGESALRHARTAYGPERAYERLLDVYDQAIEHRHAPPLVARGGVAVTMER